MKLWVLKLKDNSSGDFYFDGNDITKNIDKALKIKDKEKYIEFMKKHEELTFKEFGENAICNAGYTNMMNNFFFSELELTDEKQLDLFKLDVKEV